MVRDASLFIFKTLINYQTKINLQNTALLKVFWARNYDYIYAVLRSGVGRGSYEGSTVLFIHISCPICIVGGWPGMRHSRKATFSFMSIRI